MAKKGMKIGKGIKILFLIFVGLILMFMILMISFKFFILSMKDDLMDLNLSSLKSGKASQVYYLDKNGEFKEYTLPFGTQNRVWTPFEKIPKPMKDIIISIEDKRFYGHGGVDVVRTAGATFKALIGKPGYGGSTITQQLVKNLTEDNQFTPQRKIREMSRALIIEDKMSKDEILEAYLNIANFGSGTQGVGAAAKKYFDKEIENCNMAECAAIDVITQNPSKYNPLTHPENNKKRREMALRETYKQKKISEEEFNKAMKDSENLKFSSRDINNKNSGNIRNWYMETMCKQISEDLSRKYHVSKEIAETVLYSGGLKIYSCIDIDAQEIAEKALKSCPPPDKDLELGYVMTNYKGRVLAILGSSKPKDANLIYNRATHAIRQPGSVMKPIAVYAPAIDADIFNYSSVIKDEPLKIDLDGTGIKKDWPKNWYGNYKGSVNLQWAIEKSANAPVAQVLDILGLDKSFKFLTQNLKLSHLSPSDATSFAALATGGTHNGVTPMEIAAAYQIFGNGGEYYSPKTYFYVTNRDGNVILDNRNSEPIQAIREESSYVMNRLLRQVVVGSEGTGRGANIENRDIVGKTGTTTGDYDSWFAGLSPECVAAIWTGYDKSKTIKQTGYAIKFWKKVMQDYIDFLDSNASYPVSGSVESHMYCTKTGYLANQNCPEKKTGYYCSSNVPSQCYTHSGKFAEEKSENENNEKNKNDNEKPGGNFFDDYIGRFWFN